MSQKKKFELEYMVNSPIRILYYRLSTAGGLSEWFADEVNLKGKNLVFKWAKNEQTARIIQKKNNKFVQFKWIDDTDDSFFEFRIETDELTREVALVITDFAEEDEIEDAIGLWNKQISSLKRSIGV